MSLSALVLYKVLSDLPRDRVEVVLSLLLPAIVGFAATRQAYAASPWLGIAYLAVSSAFTGTAAVAVLRAYLEGDVDWELDWDGPVTRS